MKVGQLGHLDPKGLAVGSKGPNSFSFLARLIAFLSFDSRCVNVERLFNIFPFIC